MNDETLPVPREDAGDPDGSADDPDGSAGDPDAPEDEVEQYRMTLLEHLIELRSRMMKAGLGLLVGLAICLPFGGTIFDFLIAPAEGKLHDGEFIATKLYEAFMTDLKVGFFGALLVAMPVIAWQAWGFVAPGLYKNERRMVWPFVILSTLLFAGGIALCYFGILPYAIDFFTNYNAKSGVSTQLKVEEYLGFIIRFLIAFGAVFQTPLIIFFLARMGLVTAQGLRHFRRYAIVLGFVLAAAITPPDPGSQLAVALPFILLYEIGIVTAWLWGKPPRATMSDKSEDDEA